METRSENSGPGGPEVSIVKSRGALDREERVVKDGILRMGSLVEAQIRGGVRALIDRDLGLAESIITGDEAVNSAQREVTDTIAMTIATQSPVARDLRFLLALNHVASELERIGDHASSIAKQTRWLAGEPRLPVAAELLDIGNLAADLVAGVLRALVDVDDHQARTVASMDDEIDHRYRRVFEDVIQAMRADPMVVESGTRVILAGHWIERIGDRVTNIAEDIVYLATGEIEDLNR